MKLLRLEASDIVHKLAHDQIEETWYVNLDCVAYLQEVHHKPTATNPSPAGSFHVSFGGGLSAVTLSVTKGAFERLRSAMGAE